MNLLRNSLLILLLAVSISVSPLAAQTTYLGTYAGYSLWGKAIVVHAGLAGLRFMFYTPSILRVDFLPNPGSTTDSSLVVIRDTSASVPVTISDSAGSLTIASSALTVVCDKTPLRVSYFSGGHLLLAEGSSGGVWSNGAVRGASFQLGSGDHFYGTGERGTALDKRGQAFDSYNVAIGGYTTPLSQMNINIPFVAGTNGYALYFENTCPGHFDFGNSNPTLFSYSTQGGELSYFLIAAPTVPAQIEAYTWLTGRQPLPPRWAFGYIQSKYGYQTGTEAAAVVQTMRDRHIPCDALVLDLYWYNAMGDLSWNFSAFPQPYTMMQQFLGQGIKTIVITEPYITQYSATYSDAFTKGYAAFNASAQPYALSGWWSCGCNALLLDITNPAAQAWWWAKYPAFMGLESAGVGGLWTDLGEPERHPADMMHVLGSAARVHNMYNLLWAKTLFEGFNAFRPDRRLFNLTRSGYAGIQRYGVIPWSGDVGKGFGGLAAQLPMVLNMGMSGLAYHNSDIGGFCCGTTTDEMYVRWMQYGTFCPITRAHGVGQGTEPWAFSPQAEAIARSYIELRYRLLPYIYTMAFRNYSAGLPLARPLLFDSPDDPLLVNESSSYLWGDEVLVSPVVQQSQSSKNIYLPAGQWVDFWTEDVLSGGRTVSVPAPLDRMPIFVKAGSIVPMQPLMDYSDQRPLDTLMLEIYPVSGASGEFTLYEDDGKTLQYQTGSYALTPIMENAVAALQGTTVTLTVGASAGTYAGKPVKRFWLSGIHGAVSKPVAVVCNTVAVPEAPSLDLVRQPGGGYYFDASAHRLYVGTPTVPDSSYEIVMEQMGLTSVHGGEQILEGFRLEQNYPNPFNPTTVVSFQLPEVSDVRLAVYDILGREVATLVNGRKAPGTYSVQFNGVGLASGVYFSQLTAGTFSAIRKMVLVR